MTTHNAADSTGTDPKAAAMLANAKARRKPELILPSGDVSIIDCANQLFPVLAKSGKMFMRGGAVQELSKDENGDILLSVVRGVQFRSRIEEHCDLKKWISVHHESALKTAHCPQQLADALMVSTPASTHLPHIRGIAGCPVIANPNASVLGQGYHEENGGIIVTRATPTEEIPIREAVAYLHGLLDEFAFTTKADRARAMALILTPALRMGGWIQERCPVFTVEADKSQSGKGYLLNLASAIYGEHPAMIGQKTGGVGGFDEDLQDRMLRGRPFIQFDNLRGKLNSAFLEMVLTADGAVTCRVPYAGSVAVDTRHFIFTMTSNGVDTTSDLANRSCIIRIRNRGEFHFREYPEGDLLSHVSANRHIYLGAVFAIIAEWNRLGCPHSTEVRHHFSRWVRVLDWICSNILDTVPIMDGHRVAQTAISNPAIVWLRSVAIAVEKDGRMEQEFSASELAELSQENEIEIPNCGTAGDEERRKRIGIIMHKLIPEVDGHLEIDAYSVTRHVISVYNPARQQKDERKVYRFVKCGNSTTPTTPTTPTLHMV